MRSANLFFKDLILTIVRYLFIVGEHLHSGGVVKLVITSACHAEGRGFESRLSRHFFNEYQSHLNIDSSILLPKWWIAPHSLIDRHITTFH